MKPSKSDLSEYLINDIDEELMCSICKGLLHQPVQCENGHMHCSECLARCQTCPICRTKIGSPSRALFVEKIIGQKKVYCKYRLDEAGLDVDTEFGCRATHRIEEREAHLEECAHRWVSCEHLNCNATMRHLQRDDHQANCPWRTVASCPHCHLNDQTFLHTLSCPKEIIPCPLRCGAQIERGAGKEHKKTCGMVRVLCQFASVGCKQKCVRSELRAHCDEYASRHTQLMLEYIQAMESGGTSKGLEHRLIWRIGSFDSQGSTFYRSKSFRPSACPFSFYLGLWPRGSSGKEPYASLHLFMESDSRADTFVALAYTLSIVNTQHPALSPSRSFRNVVFPLKVGSGWGEEKILRSDMITRDNGFLDENNALVVNAVLTVSSITLEL